MDQAELERGLLRVLETVAAARLAEARRHTSDAEFENTELLRRLDEWTAGNERGEIADDPGPLIRWAAAHLRGCVEGRAR